MKSNKRYKILLGISDTGSGHRSAALALEAAFKNLDPRIECTIVDILSATGISVVKDAPQLYEVLRGKFLVFFDLAFKLTDGSKRADYITRMLLFLTDRRLRHLIDEIEPDLVISLHPLVNRFLSAARRKKERSFHLVTVVTDLITVHSSWGDSQVDLCFVPTTEARAIVQKSGVASDKVILTGFPVHPKFGHYSESVESARQSLGIDPNRHTILITSGGVDSPFSRNLLTAIVAAYPEYQVLVIAAKNTALRESLEGLNLGENVHIYGFVTNMEVIMGASDIVITKAGPGTLMEALIMGKPVIITEAFGVQERGNLDFVSKYNLGVYCSEIPGIITEINTRIQSQVTNVSSQPNTAISKTGAEDIVHYLSQYYGF